MRITLDKIEHATFQSHETECFRAIVCIDGEPMGTASNAGHGGPTFIQPERLRQRLEKHAATLPARVIEDVPQPLPMDAEWLIDELMADWLTRQDMLKMMRFKILYTIKGKPGMYETKAINAKSMRHYLADVEALRAKLKADKILNAMPEDEAFKLYFGFLA